MRGDGCHHDPMIERERRFLIDTLPEEMPEPNQIEQAYLTTGPASVRVRWKPSLASSAPRTIRAIVAPDERPALMVIDLHGQASDEKALDALVRQQIPAVAIAGTTTAAAAPATAPLRAADDGAAGGRPWEAILRRPLTIGTIVEAVARVLSSPARARGSGTSSPPPKPQR